MTDLADGYRLLKNSVASVPVERDVIKVCGPDALNYLQGQCSQDLVALGVGSTAWTLVLEPQGKVDALLRVTKVGEEDFVLDTDAGFGGPLIERLTRFKLRVKADVEPLEWKTFAVRGPDSPGVPYEASGALRLGAQWGGLDGFDFLGADVSEIGRGIETAGGEAWGAARIEAGIPLMGSEIDEKTIPAEAGLVERCVSFTKGCFTGQELVARLDSRGSNVARRLRLLVVQGITPGVVADPGDEITVRDKSVGRVTSSAWSPERKTTVALGYVHRSVEAGDSVEVRGSDALVIAL